MAIIFFLVESMRYTYMVRFLILQNMEARGQAALHVKLRAEAPGIRPVSDSRLT